MFFTYIYRELRRRHRRALLTALGLAVGVGLVVVTACARGVSVMTSRGQQMIAEHRIAEIAALDDVAAMLDDTVPVGV